MDATSFLTIAAMGAVTFATRVGGWLLFRRVVPGPRLRAWLEHLPGALFAALVAPMVMGAGVPGWIGAGAAFAAMRASGQFIVAIAAGLAAFLVTRGLLP